MTEYQLEPLGADEMARCACCGGTSRVVWGSLATDSTTVAIFYVHWTAGAVATHGANFDLVMGSFEDGASRAQRWAVSLAFRAGPEGPQFMVIDAADRPVADSELVGECLRRDQVLGTPMADSAFELIDAIWVQDERIAELTSAS